METQGRTRRETHQDEGFVLLGMPDVNGSIRGKALRPEAFQKAAEGGTVMTDLWLGLDPVDAPITDFREFGINTGAPDLLLTPDPMTLRELSWRPGWKICLADAAWPDGSPCRLAGREVLREALEDMSQLGLEVMAGFEYEIRLRDGEGRPLSSGISYSLDEVGRYDRFLSRLVPALEGLGVRLEAAHTEAGPGLLELNVAAEKGLRAADQAALVKFAVKSAAAGLGLTASFLAKTEPAEEGSSGHVHLSLWRRSDNVFAPSDGESPVSPECRWAAGGMLRHMPAASLLLNPTINSYKRLVPGFFAPVNASWGYENRSAAVRAIPGTGPSRTRLECRRPGADANPYLVLAALVRAAALGLRSRAEPPPPEERDVSERTDLPPLPNSLEEALRCFQEDGELRAALGEEFCAYYAVSRRWELSAWQRAVSDWERERYIRAV